MIKHFHVDKMLKISITAEKRLGQSLFNQFNTPKYTNSLFGMNTGEEVTVTLEVDNDWVGVLIDRFGKDIFIIPVDDHHFRTDVNVIVSSPFLGWIMSLGEYVRIISPPSVVGKMAEEAHRLASQYPMTII